MNVVLAERFWSKVDKKGPEDCWQWKAAIRPDGYGTFRYNKKMVAAHRLSWELTHNCSPGEMHVLHKCDNKKCVNTNHLFLGTRSDNMKDMVSKDRRRIGPQLEKDVVLGIKRALKDGISVLKIAPFFGVSKGAVSDIKSGRRHKNVILEDIENGPGSRSCSEFIRNSSVAAQED